MIIKGDKILLGKRKNAHGEGTRSFPGGHLEFNETVEECAIRETMEEAGITIKNITMGPFTNDIFEKEGKHYVTLFAICEYAEGEPKIMEPEKCEGWERFKREHFPETLFLPIINLRKQEYHPFKENLANRS